MHIDEQTHLPTLSNKSSRGFSKYVVGGSIATVLILTGLGWGAWSYAEKYNGYIAPNVFVGGVDIGRKTPEEARAILQKQADELLNHGIDVRYNGETKNLPLSTLIGSDLVEYVNFDLDQTLKTTEMARHDANPIVNTNKILYALIRPFRTAMRFSVHTSELNQSLHALFATDEHFAAETAFVIKPSADTWNIEVKPGVSGDQIDDAAFEAALSNTLETLSTEPIDLVKAERKPLVTEEVAAKEIPIIQAILGAAPYHLVYKHEDETEDSWKLDSHTLETLLVPTQDGTVSLNRDSFNTFLEPIIKAVNVPAQNARFVIKSSHAVKFAESKNGITVDTEKLFQDTLAQITQGSTSPILIATTLEKPSVKTAEVNDIGIDEILGYGISNYGKSPKNRKLNIQNGVNLLNGLLIAPGETFSLLEALKPFTTENGYLRELVIKGDKIEPDIGGGLCQIGTTAFRAVMHAGLPINARQNHSLVVSYYNDPSNGNPGTDATIFDPAPDFKFTNNTEHYILFEAENIPSKTELKFTLWGTSDGRKGSYTPPIVSKWIPYGDEIDQASTDLKPGEEKCQEAHKGANTSFTYTIQNPDGTKTEKVYTSHYRPLPKICLVGVNPTQTIPSPETPTPVTP
ncbi:MAG: VanW family protein [Candidatus Uhrbacteria bacterium]|nr:VanW family protein [Candidatus Uhrbacteria bacterium]